MENVTESDQVGRMPVLPDEFSCDFELKTSSRRLVASWTLRIQQQDSWAVLREKLRPLLEAHSADVVFNIDTDTHRMWMKPSVRSSFAQFWRFEPEDMMSQFLRVWRNIHRGSSRRNRWTFVVVIMAERRVVERVALRTSQQMIEATTAQIRSHRAERNLSPLGSLTEAFVVQNAARRPQADRVSSAEAMLNSSNPVLNQMRVLDSLHESNMAEAEEKSSDLIPLTIYVDRRQLAAILGLPSYEILRNMFSSSRSDVDLSHIPDPSNPSQEDEDHQDI